MVRPICVLAILLLGACADDGHPVCDACGSGQICVQKFDGTCGVFQVECQDLHPTCAGATCDPACDHWQCRDGTDTGVLTCSAPSCGTEIAGALHCYGP